jgi:hypothetical protein
MMALLVVFWTLVIFLSITWYAVLLFYVGIKGAKEIRLLTKALSGERKRTNDE